MTLNPLQLLHAHGISLHVDALSGRMRYRAPAGALTAELRDLVIELALEYEERAAIMEFDGGMDRATAERLAAAETVGCRDPRLAHEENLRIHNPWHPWPRRGTGVSNPIAPHIIKHSSAVDELRQQISELKGRAAQEEAKQGGGAHPEHQLDYAQEIGRLERIVGILQKLNEVPSKCSA